MNKYSATLHHQIFAKVNRQLMQEKSFHIHDTNDKDLRIFRNSGGTVLPLIAGGDRGGNMEWDVTECLQNNPVRVALYCERSQKR
jgi:hypothetical protein